jgi:hypothetical protein
MRKLVFTHLYQRPGAPPQPIAALEATLTTWLDHLRGPGKFAGDIILFTNVAGIDREGVVQRPYPNVPADPRHAHVHRALSYYLVPIEHYDVAMQMDLDLLAVNDINPLFPTDTKLWAAPSDAPALDWRHAYTLLPRWKRWSHRFSSWRMNELGVSACVVASRTSAWEQNFGAWARAIRAHGDRPLPHMSDQSFLNLLYFDQIVPMERWSPELIKHKDWDTARNACLLHFPCSRRDQMPRYRIVTRDADGTDERGAAREFDATASEPRDPRLATRQAHG